MRESSQISEWTFTGTGEKLTGRRELARLLKLPGECEGQDSNSVALTSLRSTRYVRRYEGHRDSRRPATHLPPNRSVPRPFARLGARFCVQSQTRLQLFHSRRRRGQTCTGIIAARTQVLGSLGTAAVSLGFTDATHGRHTLCAESGTGTAITFSQINN